MNVRIESPGFYATPGLMTDFRSAACHLEGLPAEIPGLCETIQRWFLHVFWLRAHSYEPQERQATDRYIREAETLVKELIERNPAPLTRPREHEDRLVTDCRTYAVMLAALLIHAGVPARARCGFANYFWPPEEDRWEDHWVAEYWNPEQAAWVLVDAQLDDVQRAHLPIDFDSLDVPRDRFLPATAVWQQCRRGLLDPERFAYDRFVGLPLIRWNLLRDVAALNQVEALGWDHWGGMFPLDRPSLTEDEIALYDRVCELAADDAQLHVLRKVYLRDLRLRVPPVVQLMDAEAESNALCFSDVLDGHPDRLILL